MSTRSLNAPLKGQNNRKKLDTIQLLTPGHQLCRLYGIVDLGNQLNPNYGTYSRKIKFLFEFPYLVQMYYEDDTAPKPAMISKDFTLSFHTKSSLRPFVDNMIGRKMSDAEAEKFDIFSLADKYYVASVVHQTSKKDPSKIYESINGITVYSDRFLEPAKGQLIMYNPTMIYSIDHDGFHSEAWLSLYGFIRNKIKESKEGVEHMQGGGTFAEPQRDGNQQTQQAQAPVPAQQVQPAQHTQPQLTQTVQSAQPAAANIPPSPGAVQAAPQKRLKWIAQQGTYEQFKGAGWTDQQLVDNGYAVWEQNSAVPPAPQQGPKVVGQPQATQQGQPVAQPAIQTTGQPAAMQAPVQTQGPNLDSEDDDLPF